MLRGLDEVGWDELSHAYGKALDTADLLRQTTSPDEEAAREAVSQLHSSIFHQGTVYPATVAAVPFLAELALAAPHGRADLVWMLGQLADPHHAYGNSFPDVRGRVVAQLPALLTLLADDDHQVRAAAAYAAAQARTVAEPLWQCWRTEASELAQASLVLALGLIDPVDAGPLLADVVVRGAPLVRVAAAVALLRAGVSWPDAAITAVVAAMDDGAVAPAIDDGMLEYCWVHGGDWSDELMVATSVPVARDLLNQLLRAREPRTRKRGLWSAVKRCAASRSAPSQIVPLVASALDDPDPGVRDGAVHTLSQAGRAAGRYADLLASVAARFAQTTKPGFTAEYRAVGTLARLGDPRWVEPVCAAAAAGNPAPRTSGLLSGARMEPAVLAAVRQRLADEPARADVLAGVLGTWRAAEAVPELLAALPYEGLLVARALLEIGHDDEAAVPYLRARAAARIGDLAAALAIQRITGDAQPLLDILEAVMTGRQRPPSGPQTHLGELGEVLHPLLPAALDQLTGGTARTYPQRETQILAARIVATIDSPQSVLATVRAVLASGGAPACAAADLVVDLAPAHRDALANLEPQLRDRLGDRWSRVAAAHALARLGVPTADLADPLVRGVTDYGGRHGLATIIELRAVETIPGLEQLVTSDNRLPAVNSAGELAVWADEMLSDRIRATIAALRAN